MLLVPNAALRWKPQASWTVNREPWAVNEPDGSPATVHGPRSTDHGVVWIAADGGFVRPIEVAVGTSDGTATEISGSGVIEGLQVILGEGTEDQNGDDAGEKTKNPFLPKPPKGPPPPGPPM